MCENNKAALLKKYEVNQDPLHWDHRAQIECVFFLGELPLVGYHILGMEYVISYPPEGIPAHGTELGMCTMQMPDCAVPCLPVAVNQNNNIPLGKSTPGELKADPDI